ncbi:ARR3 protein, partial [Polyodon spathula]|nr:ARR3 protein [Polyodon spathula]
MVDKAGTRVFKKSSPNCKLTVYLGKRDFVDHLDHVDPVGESTEPAPSLSLFLSPSLSLHLSLCFSVSFSLSLSLCLSLSVSLSISMLVSVAECSSPVSVFSVLPSAPLLSL